MDLKAAIQDKLYRYNDMQCPKPDCPFGKASETPAELCQACWAEEILALLKTDSLDDYMLSDEEIAESAVVCWPALQEHERRSFQLVAKAQLEKLQARFQVEREAGRREGIQAVIDYLKNEIATQDERSGGELRIKEHFNSVEKCVLQTVINALKESQCVGNTDSSSEYERGVKAERERIAKLFASEDCPDTSPDCDEDDSCLECWTEYLEAQE